MVMVEELRGGGPCRVVEEQVSMVAESGQKEGVDGRIREHDFCLVVESGSLVGL
jgi:hypothetical protein